MAAQSHWKQALPLALEAEVQWTYEPAIQVHRTAVVFDSDLAVAAAEQVAALSSLWATGPLAPAGSCVYWLVARLMPRAAVVSYPLQLAMAQVAEVTLLSAVDERLQAMEAMYALRPVMAAFRAVV